MPSYYAYSRVSSGPQVDGSGISRQVDGAELWAAARGVPLSHFSDPGRSAFRGGHRKRGPLASFLEQARSGALGEAPHLLVERADRLSREPALDSLLFILQDLLTAGVTLVVTGTNSTYNRQTLNDTPWLLQQLVAEAIGAHAYSQSLSERLKAAHAKARASGRLIGAVPAWIRDPSLVPVVQGIFARAEQGWGSTRIAADLNRRGVPTFTGRTWTASNVRALIKRPQVCGDLLRKDGTLERDYFPAAVSREQWEAARGRRGQPFPAVGPPLWVGQGITFCATCGRSYGVNASTSRGKVTRRHFHVRCNTPACTNSAYRLDAATSYLMDRITGPSLNALMAPAVDTGPLDAELATARLQVDAARGRLEALGQALEAETDPAALGYLARSLATAEQAREVASGRVDALMARRHALTASRPAPDATGTMHDPAARLALNQALHAWGLRVDIRRSEDLWGFTLPGRPTVWGRFGDLDDFEADRIGTRLDEDDLAELAEDPENREWVEAYREGNQEGR